MFLEAGRRQNCVKHVTGLLTESYFMAKSVMNVTRSSALVKGLDRYNRLSKNIMSKTR